MILKKDIKTYNSRRQINIKKNELLNEDIAFVYAPKDHETTQSTIKSLNKEVESLKQQIVTNDATIKQHETTINDFNIKFRSAIEDAKQDAKAEYEQQLQEHQQTIQQQQSMIQQLQQDIQQQHQLIKEYEDAVASHNKEVSTLTAKLSNITNRYNNLSSAVASLKRIDVLLNRQKDISNQYPLINHDTTVESIDATIKHDKV